ncbi:hypothetical protein LTR27_004233 [Elasticomyces elasticus]|nr:hypothetical protein LTR27_004233 [Elasticomyces elasticus]
MVEGSITHRAHDVEAKAPYQQSDVEDSKGSGELEPGADEHGVWGGQDYHDMMRLGKKQEFKRNFSLISALGFVSGESVEEVDNVWKNSNNVQATTTIQM